MEPLHVGSFNSAVVCPGDQLVLTCNSSANQLFWMVSSPLTRNETHSIGVFQTGVVNPPDVTVNHALYRVSITSTSPLTSEIITENVMANVNGTSVTCSSFGAMKISTTIIFINGMVSLILVVHDVHGR